MDPILSAEAPVVEFSKSESRAAGKALQSATSVWGWLLNQWLVRRLFFCIPSVGQKIHSMEKERDNMQTLHMSLARMKRLNTERYRDLSARRKNLQESLTKMDGAEMRSERAHTIALEIAAVDITLSEIERNKRDLATREIEFESTIYRNQQAHENIRAHDAATEILEQSTLGLIGDKSKDNERRVQFAHLQSEVDQIIDHTQLDQAFMQTLSKSYTNQQDAHEMTRSTDQQVRAEQILRQAQQIHVPQRDKIREKQHTRLQVAELV